MDLQGLMIESIIFLFLAIFAIIIMKFIGYKHKDSK